MLPKGLCLALEAGIRTHLPVRHALLHWSDVVCATANAFSTALAHCSNMLSLPIAALSCNPQA